MREFTIEEEEEIIRLLELHNYQITREEAIVLLKMRDIPFERVIKDLNKRHKKVNDALNTPIECVKCGGNIQELGLSRIPNVCANCVNLILK